MSKPLLQVRNLSLGFSRRETSSHELRVVDALSAISVEL